MKKLLATLMALALVTLLAIPALAQENLDCGDFTSQEEAQAVYDQDDLDPNALDADNDGVACEDMHSSQTGTDMDNGEDGNGEDSGKDMQEDENMDDMPAVMPDSGTGGMTSGAGLPLASIVGIVTLLAASGYAALRRR